MNHTRVVACILALSLGGTLAHAGPVLRHTWGDPSGVTVNQDWSGPHVYTQTLSISGLAGNVSRIHLTVLTDIYGAPAAWSMTLRGATPAPDCRGAAAFTASPTVAGAQTIPGMTLSVAGSWFDLAGPRPRIEVDAGIAPPLAADPAMRYALATLGFDHAHSVTGDGGGTACGGAELPFCFVVGTADIYHAAPDYTVERATVEPGVLTWQNADGHVDCLQAVPAKATTWGRLKAIYR